MYQAALTVGVFDMFHEGHANLLDEMRKEAEQVYVILHGDHSVYLNKGRFPVQDLHVRTRNLESMGVTGVTPCMKADPSDTLVYVLNNLKEHMGIEEIIYIRGDDWVNFPGAQVLFDYTIKYIPYTKGVSSTQRRDEL